jgi:predicted nucleotide-binding protein (sugar kinase/HSP70/actin superfamily)
MSERSERRKFWKKIRDEHYLILIPDMLPMHFTLIADVFSKHGYQTQMVTATGREVKDEGLKSVQNDACYPALICTGQFMCELKSGKYDLKHTAVMISQTGGGCRASNYLSLIKKAMAKEFPEVPVLSLNVSGLEKVHSIPISPKMLLEMTYCTLYGDLLMLLFNQTHPYEAEKGQAQKILDDCFAYIKARLHGHGFYSLKKNSEYLIKEFSQIKIPEVRKPKVGIVGEIYVKYSALANNGINDFLVEEGCEPFSPSLMEFLLYCLVNIQNDYKLYGRNRWVKGPAKLVYKFLLGKTRQQAKFLKGTQFDPYDDFEEIRHNTSKIISQGVKMGEGWLIPSEMVTLAEHGVRDIVCCQPFGCLPNHIVGKGMIRPLKAICPEMNVAAIDCDPGATKVNQENRIKLMLSNISERK